MSSFLNNKNEYDCSGCGACKVRCPQRCIEMVEHEDGFRFPKVDSSKCISCHLCERICPYENELDLSTPSHVFAATSKSVNDVSSSSSGGIFPLIARAVLENGGIVYGASFDDDLVCKHIRVDKTEDIWKLQKSKYLQSRAWEVYQDIINELKTGRHILFSGTPCQVAGLKNLTQGFNENLLTIDIACHGVPSQEDFNRYLQFLEKKHGGHVRAVDFRHKRQGKWGHFLSYKIEDGKEFQCAPYKSLYYYLFLHGYTSRKSCYQCKYAGMSRVGDLTLADCWGVSQANVSFDISNGVSAITVNTSPGQRLMEMIKEAVWAEPINGELIVRYNQPFRAPCKEPDNRDAVLKNILENGYVESKKFMPFTTYLKEALKASISGSVKTKIRRLFSRANR